MWSQHLWNYIFFNLIFIINVQSYKNKEVHSTISFCKTRAIMCNISLVSLCCFCMNNSSCQVHLAGRYWKQHGNYLKTGRSKLKLLLTLTLFYRSRAINLHGAGRTLYLDSFLGQYMPLAINFAHKAGQILTPL